jgi:hypothetical protein
MSSRSVLLSLLLVSATVVACGGAESGSPAPRAPESKAPSREPATIEEAQDDIARAKAELGGAEPSDAKRFAPAPPPPPPPTQPGAGGSSPRVDSTPSADSCQSPCRAIASMRRAVGALCRMTGDDDTRCSDAKKTLADSEAKINASCAC